MDRTQLKTLLADIFEDITGESFGPLLDEQTLKEQLKLDSLDLMSIAIELQDRIGVTVEASEVNDIVTVGDLAGLLHTKLSVPPAPANAA